MAIGTAAHGVFDVRGDHALCAFAAGKLVEGFFKIFANFEAAGVKKKVFGAGVTAFFVIEGIVEGVVTVGTFELAFCVCIPCTGECVFVF